MNVKAKHIARKYNIWDVIFKSNFWNIYLLSYHKFFGNHPFLSHTKGRYRLSFSLIDCNVRFTSFCA